MICLFPDEGECLCPLKRNPQRLHLQDGTPTF
jgi:hypothetical protein